jgi:hypothetical protein
MNRRILLGIAGWLTIAATATAGTVAALGVLEDGITGSSARPRDQNDVQRALGEPGAEPQSSTTPLATPSATPPAAGDGAVTRELAAGVGRVTARCAGGRVTLQNWSPAQGYRTDDVVRGPATTASVKFKSAADEYAVVVSCGPDGPVAQTIKDDGHHGRGHD